MTSTAQAGGVEPRAQVALKTRPPELEDGLNRVLYHPLSRRIALALQHTPVTPNMVSVASLASIVAATACYVRVEGPAGVALGLFFHILWHIVDGADGDLARLTGRTSPLGEMIDGICDYAGHVLLYTALAFHFGGWAWWAAAAAAASRIVQANHIESVRRIYQWRAYGVPWLSQSKPGAAARPNAAGRLLAGLASGYVALARALLGRSAEVDALVERLERNPATVEPARAIARTTGRRALFLQGWLGPNRRTLLLGASMALGNPGWFFLFEATALNLLLVASVARQRQVDRRMAEALAEVSTKA